MSDSNIIGNVGAVRAGADRPVEMLAELGMVLTNPDYLASNRPTAEPALDVSIGKPQVDKSDRVGGRRAISVIISAGDADHRALANDLGAGRFNMPQRYASLSHACSIVDKRYIVLRRVAGIVVSA